MNAYKNLIGNSPELQAVIRSAQVIAATDVTVIIEGETGTGKELMAQAIHQSSQRSDKTFITINCAALPDALAESEIFGHKKGAFTGAIDHHPGYAKQADGGTLFLDEVSELSLSIQAKLLRFIEYGECQSLGDSTIQRLNVRIIAASNKDLNSLVEQGKFRADLYYRLKVVPIELPSLQTRQKDIAVLVKHFVSCFAQQHKLSPPKLDTSAMKCLLDYNWPGNVRELKNMCERLVVLLPGQCISQNNLPLNVQKPQMEETTFKLPMQGLNLESLEVDLIHQALGNSKGNKSKAARLLGVSRDAFLYRLKKYSI
jgi:two-component system, NtrC family, response regulator HydG